MSPNPLLSGLEPMHPGELLKEDLLPATGKSKVEIAALLGVGRQTLYNVLDGKQAVTPNLAIRFGKLFGNSPEMWMNLQAAYDLWHAKKEVDVSAIPTISPQPDHEAGKA